MRLATLRFIDAYYDCTDSDCTPQIIEAMAHYKIVKPPFSAYGRCTSCTLSLGCNQIIQKIRQLAYANAANIHMSMNVCAKLKSQSGNSIGKRTTIVSSDHRECNCVKIVSFFFHFF